MKAVRERNQGISYNPYLTSYEGADRWLKNQQAKDLKNHTNYYTNWRIYSEDSDSNSNTQMM
jgi:hypothetical protein